jgi:hypothetical protein
MTPIRNVTGCQTGRVRREYKPPTREMLEWVAHRAAIRGALDGIGQPDT